MAAMSDVLLRVGRLNYVWTNTESLLIYIIAHLLRVEKEAAIVVFLTLNTTRARIDLIERLSKLASTIPFRPQGDPFGHVAAEERIEDTQQIQSLHLFLRR